MLKRLGAGANLAEARTASVDFSVTDRWPSPVEGAALEMLYSRKAVLGSNPNLSAIVELTKTAYAEARVAWRSRS